MAYETIKTTTKNYVLTLSLNRPDKMNAYTAEMAYEIIDAIQKADMDDDTRCIVLTGEGENFCAGADLSVFKEINEQKASGQEVDESQWRHHAAELVLTIYNSKKPIIGAIQGAAVGVGSTMILPMDIRLAEENTRFGYIFTQRGLVPEACSTWFLPRLIGMAKASEWMITGRLIPATEAKEAGLVSKVHTFDDLLPAAYEIANQIVTTTAPVSVALTRHMIWNMLRTNDPKDAMDLEHKLFISRLLSSDAQEALKAFFEKRPPKFPEKVTKDLPDYKSFESIFFSRLQG